MNTALGLYGGLLTLLQPAYRARLWWRARAEAGYGEAVGERFGHYAEPFVAPGALWIHAVSLGETRAAKALIDALRARRPGLRLLLTHGTATGRAAGRELLHPGDRQCWLPLDTPAAVARFYVHQRPALGVLMETELWPNLVAAAVRAGVPIVQANARLSAKSLARGRRFESLLRPAMEGLSLVLAQTEADAARLREGGAREVRVMGNLKFDLSPDPALLERGQAWRAASGDRPLVLAASTREGEESPLLAAWAARRGAEAGARLLLVPRHPQRFDEVAQLVAAAGLSLSRRSAWGEGMPDVAARASDVWLGDSLGEMHAYYAAARVALLGGSFEPLGGQNLIEAAACGCPLLMGPSTFNFAEAAELSLAAGASERVTGIEAAVERALALVGVSTSLDQMGERALHFAAAHRGAAGRMADAILERLPPA
ncbi:3-deoxy-D-manno-octulosonic acid transferase [Rivibacter subsaxonicus]|uniref:3-deoxy-D-manno-octulosonic acid transferase n=1 Tax=Rivibacter subsaxonicus TaxID=457575 RepID=A0A4Q7W2T7_9BURK|nr:3-deoxy-D-manno-octulosonic acid transferase [Rivibacter subsaxonicus]RZU03049.1 3-deoxy-D-manno-octulosonic-acid transferase [Rivibacter subsaxonicus]